MNKITATVEAFNAATANNNNAVSPEVQQALEAASQRYKSAAPVRTFIVNSDRNRLYNRLAALASRAKGQVRRAADVMLYTPLCDEWRQVMPMEEHNTVCAQLGEELYSLCVSKVLDYEREDDEESSAQRVLNRLSLFALRVEAHYKPHLTPNTGGLWTVNAKLILVADGEVLQEVRLTHTWNGVN